MLMYKNIFSVTETGYLNLSSLIPEREEMIRDGYFRYINYVMISLIKFGLI